MAKVKVAIEEHLCKEVEIEVPDSVVASDDTEAVLKKAIEMYENEEIDLDQSPEFAAPKLKKAFECGASVLTLLNTLAVT